MVRKILIYSILILSFLFCTESFAASIDDIINSNNQLSSAIIGISVKDANTGAIVYQKNPKTLLHPASTLKIITSAAALDYLGKDYQFKTGIYKNGNKVYLQVGADPLFTYEDILNLVSQYKNKNQATIKNFVIDDTIVDKISYGIGWQWDDNASIYFPQMSPYIINRNLFMVKAMVMDRNKIGIKYAQEYHENVENYLRYGENTNIETQRDIFSNNPSIKLKGNIKENKIIYIPAKDPETLYKNSLMIALLANNISFNSMFTYEKVPRFSSQEAIITHSLEDVLRRINTNSDNLAAETLIKHVGAIKTEKTGTTKDGLMVVREFYTNNGVNINDIIMVDASGTSMNDYVTPDFMTTALIAIKKSDEFQTLRASMSDPNIGTFQGRLNELNGKLKVKTGTLANTSAVVGYIQTNSGKDLVFSIMLDNIPNNVNAKNFENQIIKFISQF